ncbi:DEAD/DEAH box helicase [Falsihalocynthiibacter arcticus]|uniref:DNA 3'-5' helicase n=1 Tax=Falsihalocynthiibacter arcticus TaxID=1579316 RepID=A0A126V3F4_9RHOB|nr:DEAD/DEAH box helicase [Falsihalocynthiibacter arcticus]AML52830.1 hypothetical protein RC74_17595 [Falsihalocynthiibacter arcticus]
MIVNSVSTRSKQIQFRAGYFSGDMLFDVGGFETASSYVPDFVSSTFNILTRGAPTIPSETLQNSLGFDRESLSKEQLVLIGGKAPDWSQTIKGNNEGYNPAKEFFEDILPHELGDFAFVQCLIVPEYPLFAMLNAPASLIGGSNRELVDFYLPQANLVIEIDGGQHGAPEQAAKDRARDRFLAERSIATLRLRTEDMRAKNKAFKNFMSTFREHCEQSSQLPPYRIFHKSGAADAPSLRFELTASIRLQIAVMLAISCAQINLTEKTWHLDVRQDFVSDPDRDWVGAALSELFGYFDLFARLSGSVFSEPKIELNDGGLIFDIALFSRVDDRTNLAQQITVRTAPVQDCPDGHGGYLPYFGVSNLPTRDCTDTDIAPKESDLVELNRKIFGHLDFRPGQVNLILNAIAGQSTLGLMPTGGGKSLCFQIPAILRKGTTIVVVPIKALGRDHCAELIQAGFSGRVVNIDSDMPAKQRSAVIERMERGEFRFVFVSPERFQTEAFRDSVKVLDNVRGLRMFVIDEIHCLSEWGHDFRPSYITLAGSLRRLSPEAPVMGLTATASVNVLRDIQSELHISDEMVAYEMHRSRSELNFDIQKRRSDPQAMCQQIQEIQKKSDGKEFPPTHIFSRYVNGKNGILECAQALAKAFPTLRIGLFSGSKPNKIDISTASKWMRDDNLPHPETYEDYKKTVQASWKHRQLDVIVTTKAFGMGVNKPDVRHTFHAGMPSSMEAFYQEAGRAGRDREPAFCHLLFVPERDPPEDIWSSLEKDNSPDALDGILNQSPQQAHGDLRNQLWFHNQGNIGLSEELALVGKLHEIIRHFNQDGIVLERFKLGTASMTGQRLQVCLLRLYQMGLIEPWSVVDWGRDDGGIQSVYVRRTNIKFEPSCTIVLARMQAVVGLGAATEDMRAIEALRGQNTDWKALSKHLLSWIRKTQTLSRLQSTWNLYRECADFTPEDADAFRDRLEAFFKVDNDAFSLSALKDLSIEDATKSICQLLIAPGSLELKEPAAIGRLSAQLSRQLEGTNESPGLNLAAASLNIVGEGLLVGDAGKRLENALPNGVLSFWNGSGRSLLNLLASGSSSSQELIGELLVADSPETEELINIYDDLPAQAVEKELYIRLADKLAAII